MIWRVVTHLNSHDIAAMLGNLNSNHTTYELQSFRLLRGPSVRSRGPRQFNYYYQIPQSAELDPSFVNNPLLWIRIPPAFDQIRVRHIKPALEEGMRLAQLRLQRIIQDQDPPDFSNCSRRIEWASWELDYVLYVGELLASQTACLLYTSDAADDP